MARIRILLVVVVCAIAIPTMCHGGGDPFAAKASLLRFWRRTLPKVGIPRFLWEKASPLNATSVALFTRFLTNHTLSDHIASFCIAADLLCPRRLPTDEKAVSGPSDFESYLGKDFKNYKTDDSSFKNYSDNGNVVKDGFKGYSPGSNGGLQGFRNYAPGSNVVDEGFTTYGKGSNGGITDFTSYSHETNVPHNDFKNYGTDNNAGIQDFTSYADNSNVIRNDFSTYGKNHNGILTRFTSYATSSNVITNDFKGYDEKGNGGIGQFTTYAEDGNVLSNDFNNYAANGNAQDESFNNYASLANEPHNVFKAYGKDGNSPSITFSSYGKNISAAMNEFAGYAKGSNSATVGFTSYASNSTFKDYVKTGVSFTDYANKTVSSPSATVEPGKFFREKMLVQGTNIPFPDIRDYMPKRSFLPRSLADRLPFSSRNLSQLMTTFHIPGNSTMLSMMGQTLRDCERPAVKGEIKKCVTSVEGMVEFAVSVLGSDVEVLTTQSTAGSGSAVEVGKVMGKDGGKVTRSVSCHQSMFPYLVYYCHSVPKVRVYEAAVFSNKKEINEGVAICHLDTTEWSAGHGAFVALGHQPGEIEVCHWIFENDLIWVPLKV